MKRQGVQPLIIESDSLVFDCDSFIFLLMSLKPHI